MKSICCLLFVVFLVKATVADDCGHAEARLMGCFMQVSVDFQRAADPAYRQELCKGLGELIECGEKAKEDCALPQEISQTLDGIAQSVTMLQCGVDDQSACPNPMTDIQNCQLSVQEQGSDYCTMYGGYKTCLSEVQNRCGEVPGVAQSGLSEVLTNIDAILDAFNCNEK